MKNLLAQNIGEPLRGIGPFGLEGEPNAQVAASTFTKFISNTIGLMTIIAGIWFIFLFITGAIGIMTTGGDKQALEGARKKLVNGIIGLVVVVASIFVIKLIGTLIGFELILGPSSFIESLTF